MSISEQERALARLLPAQAWQWRQVFLEDDCCCLRDKLNMDPASLEKPIVGSSHSSSLHLREGTSPDPASTHNGAMEGEGYAPLHFAARFGCKDVTQDLLLRGANPLCVESLRGMTPYHLSALYGQLAVLGVLLSSREDGVSRVDAYGNTPLHYACQSGCSDTVQLLLDHGANQCVVNKQLQTPFMTAVIADATVVGDLLLHHASHGTITTPANQTTSTISMTNSILAACDDKGWTPSHAAGAAGSLTMLELLKEHNALHVRERDLLGRLPLHWAATSRKTCVQLLLEVAPDTMDALDRMNMSPLKIAITENKRPIVRRLILYGVDVGEINSTFLQNCMSNLKNDEDKQAMVTTIKRATRKRQKRVADRRNVLLVMKRLHSLDLKDQRKVKHILYEKVSQTKDGSGHRPNTSSRMSDEEPNSCTDPTLLSEARLRSLVEEEATHFRVDLDSCMTEEAERRIDRRRLTGWDEVKIVMFINFVLFTVNWLANRVFGTPDAT